MPLEKEMHGMPVPGIKKAPGFRGLFGKSRSMSCNILFQENSCSFLQSPYRTAGQASNMGNLTARVTDVTNKG